MKNRRPCGFCNIVQHNFKVKKAGNLKNELSRNPVYREDSLCRWFDRCDYSLFSIDFNPNE